LNETEQVVRDFYAAIQAMDSEKVFSLCSDDTRFEDVPLGVIANGKEEFKGAFRRFFGALSNVGVELKSVVTSGDWAACEWVFSGKQTGSSPKLPATGGSFSVRGMSMIQVRQGKVSSRTDYWDSATMFRQLGATGQPPGGDAPRNG
jgi:steroid delta-isomerase-like uncharacterized protein